MTLNIGNTAQRRSSEEKVILLLSKLQENIEGVTSLSFDLADAKLKIREIYNIMEHKDPSKPVADGTW